MTFCTSGKQRISGFCCRIPNGGCARDAASVGTRLATSPLSAPFLNFVTLALPPAIYTHLEDASLQRGCATLAHYFLSNSYSDHSTAASRTAANFIHAAENQKEAVGASLGYRNHVLITCVRLNEDRPQSLHLLRGRKLFAALTLKTGTTPQKLSCRGLRVWVITPVPVTLRNWSCCFFSLFD